MKEEALKERLKSIATEKGTTFNQIWKQFLLERFLARLSLSVYQDKFIFKGGLLLATYINIGRETTDIDFMMRFLKAEEESIENAMLDIIDDEIEDDVNFKWYKIEQLVQPHMLYNGFRVTLHARFGKMKDNIQIDIGVGDVVNPVEKTYFPFMYKDKPIFIGEITLLAYPIETIFAEKLESVVSKGSSNSRMKDYHDLLLILREPGLLIEHDKLMSSLKATFANRNTELTLPLSFEQSGLNNLQKFWTSHLSGLGAYKQVLNLPNTISEAISEINQYLQVKEI